MLISARRNNDFESSCPWDRVSVHPARYAAITRNAASPRETPCGLFSDLCRDGGHGHHQANRCECGSEVNPPVAVSVVPVGPLVRLSGYPLWNSGLTKSAPAGPRRDRKLVWQLRLMAWRLDSQNALPKGSKRGVNGAWRLNRYAFFNTRGQTHRKTARRFPYPDLNTTILAEVGRTAVCPGAPLPRT